MTTLRRPEMPDPGFDLGLVLSSKGATVPMRLLGEYKRRLRQS
jgi:hypothetical protein